MKKILLIISILCVVLLNAEIYDDYMDSLETAFSENNIQKMLNISNVLIDYDSSKAEGFYYKAYAYYLSNLNKNALSFVNMSISRNMNVENEYLKLLINRKLKKSDFIQDINKAIIKYPLDIRYLNLKSSVFISLNKLDSALCYSLKTLKCDPRNEEAMYRASIILYNRKSYNESTNLLKDLFVMYPDKKYSLLLSKAYMKLGKHSKAVAIAASLIGTEFNYDAFKLLTYNLFKKSKFDSCSCILMKMRIIYPDSSYPYTNLGNIYAYNNKTMISDTLINYSANILKTNKNAIQCIGDAFYKNKQYKYANIFYSHLAEDSTFYSNQSVQSMFLESQYDKSLKILSNASSITDTSEILFISKFSGINHYSLGSFTDAEPHFKKAYDLSPLDTAIIFNLSNTFYMNHKDASLMGLLDSVAITNKEFSEKLFKIFFPSIDSAKIKE